jgi:hypothetical protein
MIKSISTKRVLTSMLAALLTLPALLHPAQALVRIDTKTVEQALRHGMNNRGLGYVSLLGPNWIEGPDGVLINIYSPFMMLAAKAAKGDYPKNPSPEDMKRAKRNLTRDISFYTDPKAQVPVKFSVALYGESESFAKNYTARIEGFGRGKHFILKPLRSSRQLVAAKRSNGGAQPYEAINAYYFKFNELEVLDDFRFILEAPEKPPITVRVNNARLY